MPETKAEMIIRVLIRPMKARFRVPDRYSDQDAATEDYIEAMLPFSEAAIAEGFRRIKLVHEYPSWPDLPKLVATVRVAASEIAVRGDAGSSDRRVVVTRANVRSREYARWYMEQMRWPHVDAAWKGGYWREMREYIQRQAARQILDGAAEPHVEVPQDKIDAWAELAHRAGMDQPPSPEMQACLDRLLASIQAKEARRNEEAV